MTSSVVRRAPCLQVLHGVEGSEMSGSDVEPITQSSMTRV